MPWSLRRTAATMVLSACVSATSGGCDLDQPDELESMEDEVGLTEDAESFDAPEPWLAEDVDDEIEPIVDGANTVTDTDVNPQWPEVVRIVSGGGCTGTLISPVHVLTAGHCAGTGGTVSLDAAIGAGSGTGRWTYNIVQWQVLSGQPNSGSDLALVLLDQAVPSYGPAGSPEYSVMPAPALEPISNYWTTWTVGFGHNNDCNQTGFGTRRGLAYYGGFTTYPSVPGVITRANLPCDDVNKGPSPGDSGGPLLNYFGEVVGVFSGWSCRDAAGNIVPGCPNGTIEWTGMSPANTAWLDAAMDQDFDGDGIDDIDDPLPGVNCNGASPPAQCADLMPDFKVNEISIIGCAWTGGGTVLEVVVENDGPIAEDAWVDLFVGLPSAPVPGQLSSTYARSDVLEQRQTQTMYFTVTATPGNKWVDVIMDTTLETTELDEGNNVASEYLNFPDCG